MHSKLTDGQPLPVRIDGALVQVTLMRKNGERLKKNQLEAPMEGRIKYMRAEGGSMWRPEHLELYDLRPGTPCSLHKPLFQPHFGSWDERGIVINGWEIETVDGKVTEHRQMWLVVPVPARVAGLASE
jgi:hypothetical protein